MKTSKVWKWTKKGSYGIRTINCGEMITEAHAKKIIRQRLKVKRLVGVELWPGRAYKEPTGMYTVVIAGSSWQDDFTVRVKASSSREASEKALSKYPGKCTNGIYPPEKRRKKRS